MDALLRLFVTWQIAVRTFALWVFRKKPHGESYARAAFGAATRNRRVHYLSACRCISRTFLRGNQCR
jgi:hypothetical protein